MPAPKPTAVAEADQTLPPPEAGSETMAVPPVVADTQSLDVYMTATDIPEVVSQPPHPNQSVPSEVLPETILEPLSGNWTVSSDARSTDFYNHIPKSFPQVGDVNLSMNPPMVSPDDSIPGTAPKGRGPPLPLSNPVMINVPHCLHLQWDDE